MFSRLPEAVQETSAGLQHQQERWLLGQCRHGKRELYFQGSGAWLRFLTRSKAKRQLFEYSEVYYHRKRLHSKLGYLSPVAFEAKIVA
jgi:transposase InsO family protein